MARGRSKRGRGVRRICARGVAREPDPHKGGLYMLSSVQGMRNVVSSLVEVWLGNSEATITYFAY